MRNPFFSICVPTRNRAETLKYCLKTLIEQSFDDYEIIISDNSDIENIDAKILVEKFNNKKIKFFKQQSLLSMTENYEFSVSKAIGDYVICLGDDDGLVVNVLSKLHRFILENNSLVLKCPGILFYWKNNLVTKYHKLYYPKSNGIVEVNSKSILGKVFNLDLAYYHLPMIYYGCVHKTVLQKIVNKQGSLFSNAAAIDMYSGMCISDTIDVFCIPDFPFTIAGSSSKSNGTNHLKFSKKKSDITKEFEKLGKLGEEYSKYEVTHLNTNNASITWLCLNQFLHNFKPSNVYIINKEKYALELVDIKEFNSKETIERKIKENNISYTQQLKDFVARITNVNVYYPKNISHCINYFLQHDDLDATLFGLENVYDASKLCEQLQNNTVIIVDELNLRKYKRQNKLKLIKQLLKQIIS